MVTITESLVERTRLSRCERTSRTEVTHPRFSLSCCWLKEHDHTRKNRKLVSRYARTTGPLFQQLASSTARGSAGWDLRRGPPRPLASAGQGEERAPGFLSFLCARVCLWPRSTPARWVWSFPGISEGSEAHSLAGLLSRDIIGSDWNLVLSTFQGFNWILVSSCYIAWQDSFSNLPNRVFSQQNKNTSESAPISLKIFYVKCQKILRANKTAVELWERLNIG